MTQHRSLSGLRPARSAPLTPQALGAEMANQINRAAHMRRERASLMQRLAQVERDLARTDARGAQMNARLLDAAPGLSEVFSALSAGLAESARDLRAGGGPLSGGSLHRTL